MVVVSHPVVGQTCVRQILRQQVNGGATSAPARGEPHTGAPNPLVVNVSARHVHVSQEALDALQYVEEFCEEKVVYFDTE